MKKIMLGILMMFGLVSTAYGVESCIQSLQVGGEIQVLQMVFTTDSSGNFTATDSAYPIEGYLLLVETDPSATAPTTLYDITLKDANGVDVMGGALSDRSATATEMTMPKLNGNYTMIPVPGVLTMDVTNAGNSKTGTIRIYFVR